MQVFKQFHKILLDNHMLPTIYTCTEMGDIVPSLCHQFLIKCTICTRLRLRLGYEDKMGLFQIIGTPVYLVLSRV